MSAFFFFTDGRVCAELILISLVPVRYWIVFYFCGPSFAPKDPNIILDEKTIHFCLNGYVLYSFFPLRDKINIRDTIAD